MGDDNTANSNVNHGLSCGLERLFIRLLVSSDGTDANAITIHIGSDYGTNVRGISAYYIDANNIKLQTATYGLFVVQDDGTLLSLQTTAWYYRIVVVKLY